MVECEVVFTDFLENYTFSVTLISHYTSVIGFDSGEGKTWMFDSVSRKQAAGELRIDCVYPVIFSSLESLERDLDLATRHVIIVDEYTISKSSSIMKKINSCRHLILAITRTVLAGIAAPLNGIYKIVAVEDSAFSVEKINNSNNLPLTRNISGVDIVVTEALDGKSENQFLSALCELTGRKLQLVAGNGKDNVAKKLYVLSRDYPDARILVSTDLGNISAQYRLLCKRCSENSNIRFFDYNCFEELLVAGELLSTFSEFSQDVFDFPTLERYYEKKLEYVTANTPFKYIHCRPVLAMCYLIYCELCDAGCEFFDSNKFKRLLNSDAGESLYEYFFGHGANRIKSFN